MSRSCVSLFRPTVLARLGVVALAGVLLAGCNKGEDAAKTEDAAAAAFEEPPGEPPTDDECATFGEEIARGLREGDVSTFNRMVDWDVILGRAEAGLEISRKNSRDFRTGVRSGLEGPTGLAATLRNAVENGAQLNYVRTRKRGGNKSVLLRMAGAEGLNYIEFPIVRRSDGKVVATDFYIFLNGENFSQTARRMMLLIVASENRSLLDRITGKEGDFVRHIRDIEALSGALRSGDFEGGLRAFRRMPESLQRDKNVLMQRMLCAQKVNEDEYLAAMEDLQEQFPNDPCIDFISIDAYALRGELDKSLECIERLAKAVDNDAAVETLRAGVYLEKGDYKAVREAAGRAVEGGDVRVEPYSMVLVASLRERQHDETLDLLKKLAEQFGLVLDDLESNAEYAEFMKTPQYEAWREYLAAN